MTVTSKQPTAKQIEDVSRFLAYFAALHKDKSLHLLDLEGPSEIQKLFKPIARHWRNVLKDPD